MPDDEDRRAILARRQRLVAIALGGLASASPGCYASHRVGDPPTPRDAGVEASAPVPCLGAPLDAGEPTPCLDVPLDAGEPAPCLGAPLDAGGEDAAADGAAGPTPCLSMS